MLHRDRPLLARYNTTTTTTYQGTNINGNANEKRTRTKLFQNWKCRLWGPFAPCNFVTWGLEQGRGGELRIRVVGFHFFIIYHQRISGSSFHLLSSRFFVTWERERGKGEELRILIVGFHFLATLVALHSTLVVGSHAGSEFRTSIALRLLSLVY